MASQEFESAKANDFFKDGICLFCNGPAVEKFYGHHGRDSYLICTCLGRNDWESVERLRKSYEEKIALNLRLEALNLDLRQLKARIPRIETEILEVTRLIAERSKS